MEGKNKKGEKWWYIKYAHVDVDAYNVQPPVVVCCPQSGLVRRGKEARRQGGGLGHPGVCFALQTTIL